MPGVIESEYILYKGSNLLRQRLLLSTLSGRPIKIVEIRSGEDDPGVKDFEVNLLRLIDKLTNGTIVELSETGTALYFQPGMLIGGKVTHSCSPHRGIGYYLEFLLALGPFCKVPLNVDLQGITHHPLDVSVDKVRAAAFPVLLKFIRVDNGLEFQVTRRGAQPVGGGEIFFKCPVRPELPPLQWTKWGLVKRIRGLAYTLRVSPALANRVVESAKGALLQYLPDVYIDTEQMEGPEAGRSPGFGASLIAETNEGTFYCADASSAQQGSGEPTVPEDLGRECALRLLDEVHRGGAVDSSFQWMLALWMALGPQDVSTCVVGPLSDYTVNFLQHLKDFFGVTFNLEELTPDEGPSEQEDREEPAELGDDGARGGEENAPVKNVKMTCVGIGYVNYSRRTL